MIENRFLLYGANGYTGRLIARYAAEYGLNPILAGRRKESIEILANELKAPYHIFDLRDETALTDALREVKIVIHAAGPFEFTAKPMVEACLKTGTHYLDITGEISVFEAIQKYNSQAREAGIMLMPGAGFDVVPSDCLAFLLKKLLPDANDLKLAFATLGGGLSHGTALTMANHLGEGGVARINGKLVRVPLGKNGRWVDFGLKKIFVMSIPWGDLSTAWYSTGIPNIEIYTSVHKKNYRILKAQVLFNWLLRTGMVRNYLKQKIKKRPPGPSDKRREKAISLLWGSASNASGKSVEARLSGPEGYTLTAHSALIIAKKVLSGDFKTGYQTPATSYGADLVLEIPGVKREIQGGEAD